jgi:VCBS repeat-containing protein
MTTQYWITGQSGDWSDAADWVSGVVPTSTDGAAIANSAVTVDGTAVADFLTLNASYLTVSGSLTLGASVAVDSSSTLALSGGTLSAPSILSNNYGFLTGYGTASGAVIGDIDITAAGGTLKVQGSLAADQGNFTINGGAILELSNGTAAPVLYDGTSATLKLDAPTAFTGAIQDVVLGDAIDLAGIIASSATYIGTTLTVNETNGQQLIYNNVSGNLAGDTVMVASDGNGGTDVYWITGPPPIPIVEADRAHVQLDHALSVNAANGVLANDIDPIPNDTLSVSAVDGLASNVGHALVGNYGTLTLNANGSYSYLANHGSLPLLGVGIDTFSYTAADGDGGTATSTLTVVVTSPGQTYVGGTAGTTIKGGFGFYVLDGGGGNDTLIAGIGVQVLIGGPNDTLTAALGSDTFAFAPNFGMNTINHFSPILDSIELPKSEFANFAAVQSDMQQVGANTVITYDPADVITLIGVHASSLHASDFHFV